MVQAETEANIDFGNRTAISLPSKNPLLEEDVAVSAESELISGVIPANARLGIGFEQLQLVVTNQRIIVVHKAKKGRGGLASILVLGGHSGDFVDPDKPRNPLGKGSGFEHIDPKKVLASNKNNFAISFSELVRVQVDEGRESTSIAIITGDDKFQFFTRLLSREVSILLSEYLGPKLVTRKLAS